MEDAREAAVAKLAELLKHPDDLNTKVGPLARKLAKEKASIDAQLNTGVQTQLDNVQGGLETLSSSKENSDKIKDNMQLIDRLCYDAQSMIKDFPRIKKVCMSIKDPTFANESSADITDSSKLCSYATEGSITARTVPTLERLGTNVCANARGYFPV